LIKALYSISEVEEEIAHLQEKKYMGFLPMETNF